MRFMFLCLYVLSTFSVFGKVGASHSQCWCSVNPKKIIPQLRQCLRDRNFLLPHSMNEVIFVFVFPMCSFPWLLVFVQAFFFFITWLIFPFSLKISIHISFICNICAYFTWHRFHRMFIVHNDWVRVVR